MLHWKKDTELWHTRTECDQENHMIEIRQYSIRNFHIVISSNQRNGEETETKIIDRRILEDLFLGAEKLALHFHHLHHKIWFTNQSILSATNKTYPFICQDTGLFGIYLVCPEDKTEDAVKYSLENILRCSHNITEAEVHIFAAASLFFSLYPSFVSLTYLLIYLLSLYLSVDVFLYLFPSFLSVPLCHSLLV